jgi:hypothetical protein
MCHDKINCKFYLYVLKHNFVILLNYSLILFVIFLFNFIKKIHQSTKKDQKVIFYIVFIKKCPHEEKIMPPPLSHSI